MKLFKIVMLTVMATGLSTATIGCAAPPDDGKGAEAPTEEAKHEEPTAEEVTPDDGEDVGSTASALTAGRCDVGCDSRTTQGVDRYTGTGACTYVTVISHGYALRYKKWYYYSDFGVRYYKTNWCDGTACWGTKYSQTAC